MFLSFSSSCSESVIAKESSHFSTSIFFFQPIVFIFTPVGGVPTVRHAESSKLTPSLSFISESFGEGLKAYFLDDGGIYLSCVLSTSI